MRLERAARWLLVIGFVTCTAGLGRVQRVAAQAAPPQAAPGTPQGRTDQEARALFMAGQVAFEEGRFESAVQYFLQAYQLSQRAELLYNIGNTYDRLQQQEEALRHFEQYMRERPDAENFKQVEARARLLRQSVDARRAAASTAPTTGTTTPSPGAGSVPTPEETARAHNQEAMAPGPASAPAEATQASEGPSWVLWAGIGAAVAAATVVTVVLISSGGDETQGPLVPSGATTVEL